MRFWTVGLVFVALPWLGHAQSLAPRPSPQYVTIAASSSNAAVSPGGSVTLYLDVTPKRNIHVYAPGAKGFTPVSLVLTPNPAVTPATPRYPAGMLAPTLGVPEPVPVYREPFRVAQPVTISRTATFGQTLRIAGAFNYQACDETLCYVASSLPAFWTITIK